MKFIHTLTLLAFFPFIFACSYAAEGWETDLNAALRTAQDQDKHVLVDFTGSDWCGACKKLDRNVFSKPEFEKLASPHFVLTTIDYREKTPLPSERLKEVKALIKKYKIHRWPTILLIDSDGSVYADHTSSGTDETPKSFYKRINNSRKNWVTLKKEWDRATKMPAEKRVQSCVDLLSSLSDEIVLDAAAPLIEELIKIDPNDQTGYLKNCRDRRSLRELEEKMRQGARGHTNNSGKTIRGSYHIVTEWIETRKPRGVNLALALRYQLTSELLNNQFAAAEATGKKLLSVLSDLDLKKHSDTLIFFYKDKPLETMGNLLKKIEGANQGSEKLRTCLLFCESIPADPFIIGCGNGPRASSDIFSHLGPQLAAKLLEETVGLPALERARKLADGVEGLRLYRGPNSTKLVRTIHKLDPDGSYKSLDNFYQGDSWLND